MSLSEHFKILLRTLVLSCQEQGHLDYSRDEKFPPFPPALPPCSGSQLLTESSICNILPSQAEFHVRDEVAGRCHHQARCRREGRVCDHSAMGASETPHRWRRSLPLHLLTNDLPGASGRQSGTLGHGCEPHVTNLKGPAHPSRGGSRRNGGKYNEQLLEGAFGSSVYWINCRPE